MHLNMDAGRIILDAHKCIIVDTDLITVTTGDKLLLEILEQIITRHSIINEVIEVRDMLGTKDENKIRF